MKHSPLKQLCGLIATAAIALVLIGCSSGKDGQTGATGAAGAPGATGATGPAGPVSTTNESCLVCHNANDVASVATMHDFTFDTTNGVNTRSKNRYKEFNFVVSITQVESTAVTNLPKITFNVKVDNKVGRTKPEDFATLALYNTAVSKLPVFTKMTKEFLSTIIIADLVSANTTGNPYATDLFQDWCYEAGNGSAAGTVVTFDATNAATGDYSITLPQAWGTKSVSTSALATGYLNSNPKRVWLRVAAPSATTVRTGTTNLVWPNGYASYTGNDVANGYSINMNNVGNAAAVTDIAAAPVAGAVAPLIVPQKVEVTIEACRKCHGAGLQNAGHGSGYVDTLACILCHSPIGGRQVGQTAITTPPTTLNSTDYADFRFDRFIHLIHNSGQALKADKSVEMDFSEVTFPQVTEDPAMIAKGLHVKNCTICHTASGRTLGTGDKINNWKNVPTKDACTSCHTQVNFATGAGHSSLNIVVTSTPCLDCHPADVDGVVKSTSNIHLTPALVTTANVPEYVATMTVSAPASGSFYATGEQPVVTVTLKNKADGTDVPATLYTTAKHAAGTTVAGVLSKASLYVYGPRVNTVPVLTKAAATLSAAGVPTQAQSLFVDATNADITTSAAGFSYKLRAIPATLKGTVMIRFIAANYGYVADTNYKIDSTAFTTIQVNTGTADQKISGSSCVDCHGAQTLTAHDARHSVVFNTDECLSCHDSSGNHADPLHNRVHAIHSASAKGDALVTTGWADVTYPGAAAPGAYAADGTRASTGAGRCINCHSSSSVVYKTAVAENTCIGCHADKPGAIDHFKQMGGK